MKKLLRYWYLYLPFLFLFLDVLLVMYSSILRMPLVIWYIILLLTWPVTLFSIFKLLKHFNKTKKRKTTLLLILLFQIIIGLLFSLGVAIQLIFAWPAVIGGAYCDLKGPEYGYMYTNHNSGICVKIAKDKEKSCTSSSQCEGFCKKTNDYNKQAAQCSDYVKPHIPYATVYEILH